MGNVDLVNFALLTCWLFFFLVSVSKLRGLRAGYVTFESVLVYWNSSPEPFILGYRVLIENTKFSEWVAWNKSFIHIDGLHSNTNYVIKVYPVHGLTDEQRGVSSSQSINVTTDPDRGW